MQRFDYLKAIAPDAGDALAVCTGWGAREWWAVRPSDGNLKTRTLGLVSSIAAGLAIALPRRKVLAIDGDGAFLMNLCGLPTIAMQNPGNLIHLLFDNEVYEASGGTATACATLMRSSWPGAPVISTLSGSNRRKNFTASSRALGN